MLEPNTLDAGSFYGEGSVMTKVKAESSDFSDAIRINVGKTYPEFWKCGYVLHCIGNVKKNDAVVISFHARTVSTGNESGKGKLACALEQNKEPWTKAVSAIIDIPKEWTKFEFGEISEANFDKNDLHFTMQFGFFPQVIEISGISVVNLGQNMVKNKLPMLNLSYDGRNKDAEWRKLAEERIETLRKGNVRIKVTDQNGNPVADSELSVEMTRHLFMFGTCVNAELLCKSDKNKDSEIYREWLKKLFNCVVIENHLKPNNWCWPDRRKTALEAIKWLCDNGFKVRGHNAVWPNIEHFAVDWKEIVGAKETPNDPKELEKLLLSIPEEKRRILRGKVRKHVFDVINSTSGNCFQWDVINEPYSNHFLMDLLGNDVMIEWFKTAKSADPSSKLFLNDYGIVENKTHREQYLKTIKFLIDGGAPVEGIGEQGHYDKQPPGIPDVLKTFDTLGQFGLPLACTEFDINTMDEVLQADYTSDYMTAVFSHPSMVAFLMWGFWEGAHWRPDCAMLAKDWKEKPSLKSYQDLIFNKWSTSFNGKTDKDGICEFRAFLGDYKIRVKSGTASIEKSCSFTEKDNAVVIELLSI